MNKTVPKSVSDTITMLRFPLISAIVFVHAYSVPEDLAGPITGGGADFINLLIQSLISDVFGRIPVPLFFLISGYLLYYGQPISRELIKRKWRTRIFTLLIPYLLWNFAALSIQVAGQLVPATSRFFTGNKFSIHDPSLYSIADAFLGFDVGTINTPLWFLRDLMILTLLSPILYFLVSKLGKIVIPIFILIWLEIPVFIPLFISPRGLLFFSLGIWLALNEDRIKLKPQKTIYTLAAVFFFLSAAIEATLITQAVDVFYLHQFNVALGCLVIPILFYRIGQRPRTSRILGYLASTSYLIYLSHNILLQAVRKILYMLVDPTSGMDYLAIYFAAALITILSLVLVYEICVNRLSMRVVKFSIGQRVTKR